MHVELWHDWGIWFRLAIPGLMMSGMEWWVCESGSLVSGNSPYNQLLFLEKRYLNPSLIAISSRNCVLLSN